MAITVVQAAPTVQAASLTGPLTATFGSPTTPGNTLVAVVTTAAAITNPAVSGVTIGGAADNWQAAVTDPGGVQFGGAIWYDPNCAGGQTSVAVTCSGGAGTTPSIYVAAYEISGVLVFDKGNHGDSSASNTTWTSNATATTTQASEIFFGVAMGSAALPTVTGVGTWNTQNSSLGSFDQISGTQIVSVTGTATFSGTLPSGAYGAIVATFSQVAPAVVGGAVQARPGKAWLHRFHHRQVPPAAAGAVTVIGTANLAGAGAVTDVVTQIAPASAAAAGAVTAVAAEVAGTSLAGAAAGTAAVTQIAPVTAAGAAAVTDVVTQAAIASPAAAGAVTDVVTQIVTATAAGAGAVTAKTVQAATAAPAGAGSVTDAVTQAVTASLAAAGAVSASAGGTTTGAATISAAGAVTAVAAQIAPAAAAGAAAVTAKATQAVTAAPAGTGSVAALAAQGASAALTATGAVTAAGIARSPVTVARSTATVTAQDTSAATVTDPRDGTATVTATDTSSPSVS